MNWAGLSADQVNRVVPSPTSSNGGQSSATRVPGRLLNPPSWADGRSPLLAAVAAPAPVTRRYPSRRKRAAATLAPSAFPHNL